MEITSLEIGSDKAIELNGLLNLEWPEIGEFELEKFGARVPTPIAAILNGEVIGGLSFTCYRAPSSDETVVWVNALLVQAKYRRNGIASSLIQASLSSSKCLYALTDIPALYTRLGWCAVASDKNGTVVKYAKIT